MNEGASDGVYSAKIGAKTGKSVNGHKKLTVFFLYSREMSYFCTKIVTCTLQMSDIIQHQGTVESIDGSHIRVKIVQTSACATCAAHKFCNSSESKEKIIDVYSKDAACYHTGQPVNVFGTTSMGMRAVLWAFGVPFLVLVGVLYATWMLTGGNEPLSALVAMGALVVYYLILYICRHKFEKKFVFTIKSS